MTIALRNDMRIGIQVIVEGEKIDISELLVLITLFLKLAIPTLTLLSNFAGCTMAVIGGVEDALTLFADALPKINYLPIDRRDLLIVYIGLCLLGILISEMMKVKVKVKK